MADKDKNLTKSKNIITPYESFQKLEHGEQINLEGKLPLTSFSELRQFISSRGYLTFRPESHIIDIVEPRNRILISLISTTRFGRLLTTSVLAIYGEENLDRMRELAEDIKNVYGIEYPLNLVEGNMYKRYKPSWYS